MAPWIKLAWIPAAYRSLAGRARLGLAVIARGTRRLAQVSAARWRALSGFSHHLILNLAAGLLIALLLHHFHHTRLLSQIDDAAIDWAMLMFRGAQASAQHPIAFIDIDEASYRGWGEPLLTPRDKLAALIRHAIDGGAAAIVLDIDLSRPGGPGDQTLAETLRAYQTDGASDAPPLPPLILARTLRDPLPGQGLGLPQERATFLDPLVAAAPRIHWAAPRFELEDGKVRRWRLWTAVCGTNGEPLVRPSIQLLVAALLDASGRERADLDTGLARLTPGDCTHPDPGQANSGGEPEHEEHQGQDPEPSVVTLAGQPIHLQPHPIAGRIGYRIPWHLAKGESRPLVSLAGHRVPLLSVRPAGPIVDAPGAVSSDWLRGHLVIIGSSHQDSGDLYTTPIGLMPGALVIANAINSMDGQGELHAPGLAETLAVEAGLIAAISLLFAWLGPFLGGLLSAVLVGLILLPLSLIRFERGLWLSFAIPLIAILFHQTFDEIKKSLTRHDPQEHRHD